MGGFVYRLIPLLLLSVFFYCSYVPAQDLDQSDLKKLQNNLARLRGAISQKENELSKNISNDMKARLEKDLETLEEKKDEVERQFIEASSGVTLENSNDFSPPVQRDIVQEVKELLAPFLSGLRRVSEKPRKIEKMRFEIDAISGLLSSREVAMKNIQTLLADPAYQEFAKSFEDSYQLLVEETDKLKMELDSRQRELARALGDKRTFWEEVRILSERFFKTKGKNLLYSVSVFVAILLLTGVLRRRIFRMNVFCQRWQFLKKAIRALYNLLALAAAVGGAILTLYIVHDWALVTVAFLLMVGILWSFKNFLPRFVEEIRLMLNLGPIREGERVMVGGIPWKIEQLGFTCLLKNPCLQGGEIRIPAKSLIDCNSRPTIDGEPWFPSTVGDWVILSDGIFGQVELQTQEWVLVKRGGLVTKQYTLVQYLAASPENLSQGFFVDVLLGLDYSLQKSITHEVQKFFQRRMEELFTEIPELQGHVLKISVNFRSAESSSLNLGVNVQCAGGAAPHYFLIKRKIQEFFVQICNEKNYSIPFNQLTVHLPREVQSP
jgi:hypothetical protein